MLSGPLVKLGPADLLALVVYYARGGCGEFYGVGFYCFLYIAIVDDRDLSLHSLFPVIRATAFTPSLLRLAIFKFFASVCDGGQMFACDRRGWSSQRDGGPSSGRAHRELIVWRQLQQWI
jgi:hypothetical protein